MAWDFTTDPEFQEQLDHLSPAPIYHTAPVVTCSLAHRVRATTVVTELLAFCRARLAPFKCPRRLLKDRYWGDRASRIV